MRILTWLILSGCVAVLSSCGDSGSSNGGFGGSTASGGNTSTGGTDTGTGGASGATNNTGGANTGGTNTGGANTGGANTGGTNTGGTNTGGTNTGGTTNTAGCAGTDPNGKANASPGATTSVAQDYLRMCDIRLINNNWGSQDLNCNTPMSVFINADGSFGWNFNRGDCDAAGSNQHPDFPQLEFGIHPFGIGSTLATSPDFTSTSLLPLQIKNISSASVTINNMSIALQRSGSWNITFEFWLSQRDPRTTDAGVYAEIMTFWGWQSGRWPEPPAGTGPTGPGAGDQVSAGTKTYKLEVQSDTWANGQWRYFQFRATDGPQTSFNGTVNVKALLNYLVNNRGYSQDLWVTRFEIGSEIDDLTQGTVTMQGVTFEVNGQNSLGI